VKKVAELAGKEFLQFGLKWGRTPRFAFPHNHHSPTLMPERTSIATIAFDIRESFGSPELCIRCGHYASISTFVHVKEAAMYIDYLSMSNKYDVRFTRKILLVKSISKTHSMNDCSNDYFRARVAVAYPRHVEASLFPS